MSFQELEKPPFTFGLDYDGTYTQDPELWDAFIALARTRGHRVVVVTMRYPAPSPEALEVETRIGKKVHEIFYTGRKAKIPFMHEHEVNVDVWIDDNPIWIFRDAK